MTKWWSSRAAVPCFGRFAPSHRGVWYQAGHISSLGARLGMAMALRNATEKVPGCRHVAHVITSGSHWHTACWRHEICPDIGILRLQNASIPRLLRSHSIRISCGDTKRHLCLDETRSHHRCAMEALGHFFPNNPMELDPMKSTISLKILVHSL